MRTALKELLHQPDLPQVLERAQQYLKEEAVRREQFYDDITSHAIPGFKIPVNAIFLAADNLALLKKMQS